MYRLLLLILVALTLVACGGANNAPRENQGEAGAANQAPEAEVKSLTALEVRDTYIAAIEKLDDTAMIKLLTEEDKNGTAGKWIRRGFETSRQSSDSYTCEVREWEDKGEYWTCRLSQTMNLKDGSSNTLPASSFHVVKEGERWRVSWNEPESD